MGLKMLKSGVEQDRLLELLSMGQLFDLAQETFESDWETCWRILTHIDQNLRAGMLLAKKIGGPSYEQMYGECLRLKINDLFPDISEETTFGIPEDLKKTILLELIENLKFENASTPIAASLEQSTNKKKKTLEPDWPWPIPDVTGGKGKSAFAGKFADVSALKLLGYSVGTNGLGVTERKELLERFFTGQLPSIVNELFGDAWGNPGSEERLKKMADTISSNCKNFKRNDASRYRVAIEDWESDLSWLRKNFYKKGRFPWPDTFAD